MKRFHLGVTVFLFVMLCVPALAQLPSSSTDISPLLIGEEVSDANLTDVQGNQTSLADLVETTPAVIIFYRGVWCGNCVTHFSEEIDPIETRISDLGFRLIAISPDSPEHLREISEKTGIDQAAFFSDGEGDLTKAMGVAFQQQERMLDMLSEYSDDKNDGFLPVPGVFVINPSREITFVYINPLGPSSDLRIRGDFLIAVLQALP